MDKEYLKACGFQNPLVYHLRDITDNHLVHRALASICAPSGIVKALLPAREIYKKKIALVAIAKNEGPYLTEWIEFYLKQGFDNIILFDNDSTDNTKEVLQPYINIGFVIYSQIHGKMRQYDAYNNAIDKYKKIYKYLAFVDCDEFLFCVDSSVFDFVDNTLSKVKKGGGIGVNWLVFGSSGFENKPDGFVIDNYLYRAKDNFEANHHIKTICNPRRVLGFSNPHSPCYRKGYFNYDEEGNIIDGPKSYSVKYNHIRCNHYFTKSKEEYIKKISRGKSDSNDFRDMRDFLKHDKNDVFDNVIIKWKKNIEHKEL